MDRPNIGNKYKGTVPMYKNRKMRYNKSTTLLESTDINCKEFSEINQFQFKATKERKTNWSTRGRFLCTRTTR